MQTFHKTTQAVILHPRLDPFSLSPPKRGEGRGENSPTKDSRIEPLNLEKPTTSVSLAPIGGEGWGEGAPRVQGEGL